MARLIPRMEVDAIALKPERDVARALVEQLPADSIVYHSYPWLKADRHDRRGGTTLREGEADFVVVLPCLGFLVLEVKGGEVRYDPVTHQWLRVLSGGKLKKIKDPFHQARENVHFLEQQVVRHSFPGQDHVPCAFGYAVVFPDCEFSGPMPPGAENAIVLSAHDLPFMQRRLTEILRQWAHGVPRPLTGPELDGILKGLSPSFQLLPVLFRRIEEQEERLFRLTEEQLRLLDFLGAHPRAAIEGVAGSGKTLLAESQALRFADQGLRTLLLCYNRTLAQWLADSMPKKYAGAITVSHFHSFCYKQCQKVGLGDMWNSHRTNESFWRDRVPELLMDAVDRGAERFEALVVDEGQDFYPNWWVALELILSSPSAPFYIFYDPAQNLYVGENWRIPNMGPPFRLPTNCRNTRNIAQTCSRVQGVPVPVRPDAPLGDEAYVQVAGTAAEQSRACQKILGVWLGAGQLRPGQVALLGPHRFENSALCGKAWLRKVAILEDLDCWRADQGIFYSTIRSFKGLEADAVVILEIPEKEASPHFTTTDLYVACSRAKHLLAVLPQTERAAAMLAGH